MPIYEYRCQNCGQANSLFKPTIAEAETAQADLRCSRCGSPRLKRLLSRFAVGQTGPTEGEELYHFDRMTQDLGED